ncbi:unnamed protein product [Jaminaea pallidilutea]
MSARLLRGLTRRLTQYHLAQEGLSNASSHGSEQMLKEARQTARVELRWLREEVESRWRQESRDMQGSQRPRPLNSRSLSAQSHNSHSQTGKLLYTFVARRTRLHEPLAYIIGHQPFGPLNIAVAPPTLIPRPETEEWGLRVADRICEAVKAGAVQDRDRASCSIQSTLKILDLCTGTGCLGLLLATSLARLRRERPDLEFSVTCSDLSTSALDLVRRNIQGNNHLLASGCKGDTEIHVHQGDLFSDSDVHSLVRRYGPFDVIVCNPPYIPVQEWRELDVGVKEWEDRRALVGERRGDGNDDVDDGLVFYRRIAHILGESTTARKGQTALPSATPLVALEVGKGQAREVASILVECAQGVGRTEIWEDAWGIERVVVGFRK